MSNWAIIGCGYVGRHLAARLLESGHQVTVTSRSDRGRAALAEALPKASARRYQPGTTIRDCSTYQVFVLSAPPGPNSPESEGAIANQLRSDQRLIYLSTTGVYAAAGGALVADDFPLGPGSERSQMRLQVEQALVAAHPASIALRIASIYGPGRGVHARMRQGNYRLIGEANTMVSRIYVDDLVAAISMLGDAKELAHSIYVIGDEEPTSATTHARGVAARLALAMPPSIPDTDVSLAVRAMLGADRRIVPNRLHALGWRAQYPSWREGLEKALEVESSS